MPSQLESFARQVDHYAGILNLRPTWTIWVMECKLDSKLAAMCHILWDTNQACIQWNSQNKTDELPRHDKDGSVLWPIKPSVTAAHELLHIYCGEYFRMFTRMMAAMPQDTAGVVLASLAEESEERLVDSLAELLVKAYPLKED